MKKLVSALFGTLVLLGTLLCPAHANRKPWDRRPGIVLYHLKTNASIDQRSAVSHAMGTSHENEEDLAEELMKTGAVTYAEPDYLMPVASTPNDPGFPSQWYHTAIHSQAAWDITTGASTVLVAVCDTGIDASHPDLIANLSLPGHNSANGTTDTTPIADHGTAVAGIIGALGNNSIGGAGIAWKVGILPVRVSNNLDGSAWCSDMASGIEWAADHGAKVINLSYDITGCPYTINDAAQYAKDKGAITFVAAGNSGLNLTGTIPEPHAYIFVGASDATGQRASFSNYGEPMDLIAPGVSIYAPLPGNTYSYGSGTSFSAPIASGVAALLFSMNSTWTPDQIRLFLLSTAEPASVMNGYGRVDAGASVSSAKAVLSGGALPTLPTTPGVDTSPAVVSNLDNVLVYPNPWRSDRHSGVPVVFGSVTDDSAIKIFTMSGYLTRTLSSSGGKASWDLKNDSGELVASGIYLYSITNTQGQKSQGKLAVIR